jgi:two-component system chemotaxis response regulator CheB
MVSGHNVVAIGASAGGVEALRQLVSHLPADLGASLFVTIHLPATSPSVLPGILARAGALPAQAAIDGETFRPGTIYVAPPDAHLIVKRETIRLVRGPKENGHRPAIDPLLRSAARVHGRRSVGIVLTGSLDDGAAGLHFLKSRGGIAIVQDPNEAAFPSMPLAAMQHVTVDHVAPLREIADLIASYALKPVTGEDVEMSDEEPEMEDTEFAAFGGGMQRNEELGGALTGLTCPECSGPMWEIHDGPLARYRCRVGHSYSEKTLIAEKGKAVEAALWMALEVLEENAVLAHKLAVRAVKRGAPAIATRFEQQARTVQDRANVLRDILRGPALDPGAHLPAD